MTVLELFLKTIQKCYKKLVDEGYYKKKSESEISKDRQLMDTILTSQIRGFIKRVQLYNFANFKKDLPASSAVTTYIRLMYVEKFVVVKRNGRAKRIFAKDSEEARNVQYIHYLLWRQSQDIVPASIVNKDVNQFEEFNEQGYIHTIREGYEVS